MLPDLGRDRAWLGDGRLRINVFDNPTRDLGAAHELSFVPHHGAGSHVGWELPTRYALYYPVTGVLAESSAATGPPAAGAAR